MIIGRQRHPLSDLGQRAGVKDIVISGKCDVDIISEHVQDCGCVENGGVLSLTGLEDVGILWAEGEVHLRLGCRSELREEKLFERLELWVAGDLR